MSIEYCHSHHTIFDADKWRSCPECSSSPITIIPYEFSGIPIETIEGAGIGLCDGTLQIHVYENDWEIAEIWFDAYDEFTRAWVDRKAPPKIAAKLAERFLSDEDFCHRIDGLHREALMERALHD